MWKKAISFAFSATFALSSIIGGGIGLFPNSPVAFAEESNEEENGKLSAGIYALNVYRQVATNNETANLAYPEHINGRALLTVDENGSQAITIGVEHWSLYEAFVPCKQEFNDTDFSVMPAAVFNEDNNLTNFDAFISENTDLVSDEANSWYAYSTDKETKFGNILVTENNDLDLAYISFEIDDISKPFSVQSWFSVPVDGNSTRKIEPGKKWYDLMSFRLDTGSICNVNQFFDAESFPDDYSFNIANASTRTLVKMGTGKVNSFNNRVWVQYPSTSYLTTVFDAVEINKQENGSYVAKYHVNDNNCGKNSISGESFAVESNDFKLLSQVSFNNEIAAWDNWDNWLTGTFEDLTMDERNNITISYESTIEMLLGRCVFFNTNKNASNQISFCEISVIPKTDSSEMISLLKDDETGIYVEADEPVFPKDASLSVKVNAVASDGEDYYSGLSADKNALYTSRLYKNPKWYTISVIDANGNNINVSSNVNLFVPIPDDYSIEKYFIDDIIDGEIETTSYKFFVSPGKFSTDNGFFRRKGAFNCATIVIAEINETENIHDISEDGIYKANAYLVQELKPGLVSMADGALNRVAEGEDARTVYIVIKDGVKKMYFKSGTVNHEGYTGCYVGDYFCNNREEKGKVYDDSILYTEFLTDESGKLVDNIKYDAISEWACVKGGILTLMDESYLSDRNVYELAVASPVMSAIGEEEYQNTIKDSLLVWLKFTDVSKCDSLTENDVKALYPYDISALTRQVEFAKLKIASKKSFSTDSIAKVQKAYDEVLAAFGGTYDPLNKAEISADKLEELGTNLKNAIKALDGITVAGYNAQLDKDVTFDFYLSMNKNNLEAAQDGDLKANITKADGSTETVEVGEDGKIEFNVAPKEIGQTLKVKIGSYEFTYSVQEYLEKLIWYAENPTEGVEVSEKDAAIAKSLLVYGGYAQDYFVKKDAEANAYVDTERAYANVDNTLPETADNATTFTAPQLGDNIKYYGAAVVFDYTTDIRLYFTVDDAIENHSFAVNDKAVDAVAVDGGYYIAIENIYANQLGNPFKITVDGTDFQYGVYNYIAAALNATEVKSGALNELQALVKALYQYAELTKTTA